MWGAIKYADNKNGTITTALLMPNCIWWCFVFCLMFLGKLLSFNKSLSGWTHLSAVSLSGQKRERNGEPIYLLAVKCVQVIQCKLHIFNHEWCVLYSRLLVLWHFVHHHNTGKWFNRAQNIWAKSFDPLHGCRSIIIWACFNTPYDYSVLSKWYSFFAWIQCCLTAYILVAFSLTGCRVNRKNNNYATFLIAVSQH